MRSAKNKAYPAKAMAQRRRYCKARDSQHRLAALLSGLWQIIRSQGLTKRQIGMRAVSSHISIANYLSFIGAPLWPRRSAV